MSYCKHQWEDRTQVLREVFAHDAERSKHVFFVCGRCMKIRESMPEPDTAAASPTGRPADEHRINAA